MYNNVINQTFHDITIDTWLIEYAKIVSSYPISPKTLANRLSSIKEIRYRIGDRSLISIKPYEIANMLQEIYNQFPQKAKRLLIELRNMWREAIIYDVCPRNPAAVLKNLKVKVARTRLSVDTFRRVYAAALYSMPQWVSNGILLALVTAQRRGDLVKLRMSDISDGRLLIEQQKCGSKIAIPLSLRLEFVGTSLGQIIERINANDFIISTNRNTPPCAAYFSAVFEKAKELANVSENVTLHECRSLSERLYRAQGVNTRVLLGHTSWKMTDMYHDDRGLSTDTFNEVKYMEL